MSVHIDGREILVEAGTTVLDAARQVGIEIPTLCHIPGVEPVAACFLCCVQVEGARTLSPACALPVAPGMVVTTHSDDIRAARKMALELLLSDHAGECIAPCVARCPAGLDVPGFVYEIASRQDERVMGKIYERLALPGSLGRVCPRLCEQSCRRCEYDGDGLAIGALHRFATDRDLKAEAPYVPPLDPSSGKRVAIVGAGPAGLSAAFHLLQRGHACTLFDTHERPGGMLRYGIPEYRLPKSSLDAEIAIVEGMGARFEMNQTLGRDITLAGLREEFDAVFLGIGAQLASNLHCEGEGLAVPGLDFLRTIAEGQAPELGRHVVVVGGGNTAMDAARSARRLGAAVRVFYRRTRDEMPCLMEEVDAAEAEGVEFTFLIAPLRLERLGNGHALRLVCQRMQLGEPDASGRRRPLPIPESEMTIDCDAVITAVGQAVDRDLAKREGVPVNERGIETDSLTLATDVPGVFAGGDAVLGADVAVRAVAAGRIAAISIAQYLAGADVTGPVELTAIAMRPIDDGERAVIFREIERAARVTTSTLSLEQRLSGFDEIDAGLADEQAREESLRCLSCGCPQAIGCGLRGLASEYGANPYRFLGQRRRMERDTSHPDIVYEPGKCIMCDGCVRIAAAAGEELGVSISGRGFDVSVAVPFDHPLSEGLRVVGRRCAEACPTGALAVRGSRACDLAGCGSCLPARMSSQLESLS